MLEEMEKGEQWLTHWGTSEAEVWQVAKEVTAAGQGRGDPGSTTQTMGGGPLRATRCCQHERTPKLGNAQGPFGQRLRDFTHNGLAKTETRTARYPEGGDNVVQRWCLNGSAVCTVA